MSAIDYLDAQRMYRDAPPIGDQTLFNQRVNPFELEIAAGSGVQ